VIIAPERAAGELRGLLESAIDALPHGRREVFVVRKPAQLSSQPR